MDSHILLNIVSIILSISAIILSFIFYKESHRQNKETIQMQIEIKNAVSALNKLYDCTFENVFGLIKTHMNVMQTHIFRTVGETGTETPNGIIKKKQGVDADKNENT